VYDDEMGSIQDNYTEWSETYDRDQNLTRDLDQIVMKNLFSTARYLSILELGCGTGKNTQLLTHISKRIWAMDLSPGMLKQAKRKIHSGSVMFLQADITEPWPVKSESFDLIACNLVLEHIENLVPVFREAQRALAPGGQLFVCELHPFRQYEGKKAIFKRGQKTFEIPAFIHNVSDYVQAADQAGSVLLELKEWWHEQDENKPPRLLSFRFLKKDLIIEKVNAGKIQY
jgi:malonyl-CoA O-methyltransferase